jgi:ATP-binding cassette, subfamily B, bacterial
MKQKVTFKDIAAFSWHIWKQEKKLWPLVILGLATAGALDAFLPVVTGKLIREINNAATGARGWTDMIVEMFFLFGLLELVYHTVRNTAIYFYNKTAVRSLHRIVSEGFAKVQRFSTDWHSNAFAGGTVRKITRGMWSFDVFEDVIVMFLLPTAIVMITTVTIMFLRWPIMGWVTLACVVAYTAFGIFAVVKVNAPRFRKSADADTKVGAALADAITGNAAVKAFGRERSEEEHFAGIAGNWRNLSIRSWQMANAMDLIRRYIALCMMMAMVGTAIHLWAKGVAEAADVVYAFTAYLVLSAYLRNIGEQISNMLKAASEMEDIVLFWKREDDIADAPDAKMLLADQGEIRFDHVTFAYANKEDPIYKDFSITIKPGEKVALVGYSGSGKSTFVKLLQRLYDVQDGQVMIDGQDIRNVTQESLRKAIALVPQEPILFHRSIATNIAYGKPEASMEQIVEAAKRAYAHDFITSLPHGYDTLVGERGVKLSGGERQRVAIARAILADCPVLILDEATSSLDSVSEHYIQKALESLMENRTTITIAHRLATIKAVDRILVFDDGRIIEQGTHTALLADPNSRYKALYDMQALDLIGEERPVIAAE